LLRGYVPEYTACGDGCSFGVERCRNVIVQKYTDMRLINMPVV
jgi:hypothetical protein